jgi:hypothetical protein
MVIFYFLAMGHREKHGHLPFMKQIQEAESPADSSSSAESVEDKGIAANVR